jgi:hypothetical protein
MNALCICHACGFDLRSAQPQFIEWSDVSSWELLLHLNSHAELAGWDIRGLPCPLPFFNGLRSLITIIFGFHSQSLREAIDGSLRKPHFSQVDLKSGFEFLEIDQRLKVMLVMAWLLVEWPQRFKEVSSGRLLTRSQARGERGLMPFWVERVFGQDGEVCGSTNGG